MIFISAGHHVEKQGASFNDVTEFHLATIWADRIFELIGPNRSVRVPDGFLTTKVSFINKHNADLAVEIHFNSCQIEKDGKMQHVGRGSETLYYPGSSKGRMAAGLMQDSLSVLYPPNRGAKEGWYRMNPENGPDYFLKKTRCVSLIIEPEFIDNLDKIQDEKHISKACFVIASALLEIKEELSND